MPEHRRKHGRVPPDGRASPLTARGPPRPAAAPPNSPILQSRSPRAAARRAAASPAPPPPPPPSDRHRPHHHHHHHHHHHPLRRRWCAACAAAALLAALQSAAVSRTAPWGGVDAPVAGGPDFRDDRPVPARAPGGGGGAVPRSSSPARAAAASSSSSSSSSSSAGARVPRIASLESRGGGAAAARGWGGNLTGPGGAPPPPPPRRRVDQYPAEYSDVTQTYPTADSADPAVNGTMEWRVFPRHETNDDCVPAAEWQTASYPTCNAFHEIDARSVLLGSRLSHLGSGSWRDAWLMGGQRPRTTRATMKRERESRAFADSLVLKTLRYDFNVEDLYFELNRVDAMAMERLTSSKYVVDVFGMCGLSLLTEFARETLTKNADRLPPLGRLELVGDIARGLADVHGIDGAGRATLVHNDINSAHIMMSNDKVLRLNDFNVAVLLMWDQSTNETCGFESHYSNPQWQSPEEQRSFGGMSHEPLTEKVDIYALGNICYRFATGSRAWWRGHGSMTEEWKAEIIAQKREGGTPPLPPGFDGDSDPAMAALLAVMRACFRFLPRERPTASEVARMIDASIAEIKGHKSIGLNSARLRQSNHV